MVEIIESGKEEQKFYPDLKQFILVQLEKQIFTVNQLLYENQPFKAMRLLKLTFELLPPEVKTKLEKEKQILNQYSEAIQQVTTNDFFTTHVARHRIAKRMVYQFSQILGKIQDLLYDYYLRTGYRGINLSLEAETLKTEENEEE